MLRLEVHEPTRIEVLTVQLLVVGAALLLHEEVTHGTEIAIAIPEFSQAPFVEMRIDQNGHAVMNDLRFEVTGLM